MIKLICRGCCRNHRKQLHVQRSEMKVNKPAFCWPSIFKGEQEDRERERERENTWPFNAANKSSDPSADQAVWMDGAEFITRGSCGWRRCQPRVPATFLERVSLEGDLMAVRRAGTRRRVNPIKSARTRVLMDFYWWAGPS